MKKIIFFDGDGTLWYPKITKYSKAPHWVYHDPITRSNPNIYLALTPTTRHTLKKLKKKGIKTIILSASPYPEDTATQILKEKTKLFGLYHLFDEIHATRPYQKSKGEFILEILKRHKIPKTQALMIGDIYLWDYKPAKDIGIDALLIESEYRKLHPNNNRVRNTIKQLKDILDFV